VQCAAFLGARERLVITFQSIMFVALGFLSAVLLAFVIAPAFWARAVRLTTERIRAALPLTEREIRAEQDRVRAENAIRIYRLTAERDKARMAEARQTIEINRRDAAIGQIGRRLERVEAELDASDNARRVLEATIKERVPEIEKRLMEARQLLAHRDQEMRALREESSKSFRALDDAMQMNAQQRGEIERLKTSLAVRTGRPQTPPEGAETDAALRSELERLRARTRDQAGVIKRFEAAMRAGGVAADGAPARPDAKDVSEHEKHAAELAAAQEGLEASREALLVQVRSLSEKVEAQAGEIADLRSELARAGQAGGGGAKGKGLPAAGRARKGVTAGAGEGDEIAARDKKIADLRRELAMANERIARQASYYMEELRRLGPRTARSETPRSGGRDHPANGARGTPEPEAQVAPKPDVAADTASATAGATKPGDGPSRNDVPLESEAALADGADGGARPKLMDRIAGLAKR
jgi:hypothetical protein